METVSSLLIYRSWAGLCRSALR